MVSTPLVIEIASHGERPTHPGMSAGRAGVALAPPAYGMDVADRQPIEVSGAAVQRQAQAAGEGEEAPRAAQPNRTGLPDTLKAGIERLSGIALDDVRVHYNSSKPAQLQALAYAQGAQIHVAPGHERHLPHEAWHVVQQKQGRVRPTLQLKGAAINDDGGLEREADVMGAQALRKAATEGQGEAKGTTKRKRSWNFLSTDKAGRSSDTSPEHALIQRTVSPSATFPLSARARLEIAGLDGHVAKAETDASNAVLSIGLPVGYVHTATQAAYISNPTPALWGSCVEEQLNTAASANGWQTQYALPKARPDYRKLLPAAGAAGSVEVWADLTTVAEAGTGGSHITAKLQRAQTSPHVVMAGTWEAGDITHSGLNPAGCGPLPPPIYNGKVTRKHIRAFQGYRAFYDDPDADFTDAKNAVARAYRSVSLATFTQTFTEKKRDNFAKAVQTAGFLDG